LRAAPGNAGAALWADPGAEVVGVSAPLHPMSGGGVGSAIAGESEIARTRILAGDARWSRQAQRASAGTRGRQTPGGGLSRRRDAKISVLWDLGFAKPSGSSARDPLRPPGSPPFLPLPGVAPPDPARRHRACCALRTAQHGSGFASNATQCGDQHQRLPHAISLLPQRPTSSDSLPLPRSADSRIPSPNAISSRPAWQIVAGSPSGSRSDR